MFSSLRIYTVHIKPEAKGSGVDKLRFVPEGFSWMAFLFSTLWLLYHRLWLAAGVLVAVNIATALLVERMGLDETSMGVLQFGVQLWIGYHAHDLLRSKLRRSGYITLALVSGENEMRAEQRFFDRHGELVAAV